MSFTQLAEACAAPTTITLNNGKIPLLLLDGGMGTCLQLRGHNFSDSPLWSASLIEKDGQTIVAAHSDYLEAGADIIMTNTYQASKEQFARAGTNPNRVPELCRSAVDFAAQARQQYLSANASRPPKIALSMGSYGSSIPTAAEYHGIYPPPFGPVGVSALGNTPEPSNVEQTPSNAFNAALNATAEEKKGEAQAEHALFEWHLERLRMYADDEGVWKKIDVLAFETIPLAREARAIRRAVSELFSSGTAVKPWWMTFTFPEGNLPQEQHAGGPPMTTEQLLEAIFSPLSTASGSQDKGDLSTPPAIGVNCTVPSLIPELVKSMSDAMFNMVPKPSPESVEGLRTTNEQPNNINSTWLVVYPNGRHIYQPSLRRWVEPSGGESGEWADDLLKSIRDGLNAIDGSPPWGGIILGGCCRTGPNEIRQLCRQARQE